MAKYYCVLFDADNTLLNFDAAESKALAETLVNYGIEPDAETVQTYRTINSELWRQLEKGQIKREKLMAERFLSLIHIFAMNTAPQVVSPAGMVTAAALLMALTMAIRRCTRAVKVTHSMMISGGKIILLLRPVTFRNTHRVARTRALSSWFAEPNRGQMLA